MIVLLRATAIDNAMIVAEKIRKNLDEHTIKDDKNTYHVTISLGVSMFMPEGDTGGARQMRIAFANVDREGIARLYDRLAGFTA